MDLRNQYSPRPKGFAKYRFQGPQKLALTSTKDYNCIIYKLENIII